MRILHCIPSMGQGGAERQLAYMAAGLHQIGWEVHVALISGGPNYNRLKASGAVIHKVSCKNSYDPSILWQLRRILNTIMPVLMQTWLMQMDILGGVVSLIKGIPWILSERASELAYPKTVKSCVRSLMASKASAIISNSAWGHVYWKKQVTNTVPQYVIPNALPVEEIQLSIPASLADLGIEPQDRLIFFAGRFDHQKNIDNLILALCQVVGQLRAVAVLCGDGPLQPGVAHQIKDHGLSGRVLLPGYVPELWSWMKRADVFVSVSLFEGRPNTVLEAIACDLPLVVSDIPEHREFLDEHSALLVNPHAPAAIANAIVNVLSAPEAAARRACTARAKTGQLSIQAIARQYAQVYQEVLARRTRPSYIQ